MKIEKIDFLEWKNIIEELKNSKLKLDLEHEKAKSKSLELKVIEKELHIKKLSLQNAINNNEQVKTKYNNYKKELESKLKISLNNCSIDPITLEINNLENTK